MYIISPILVKLEPDFPQLRGPKSHLRVPNKSLLEMTWPQSEAIFKILYMYIYMYVCVCLLLYIVD